jgi:quercetin dioxygenase-like cupin family protein
MSLFTKVSLKAVEDMAPRFGFSPQMESRFARDALGLEQSALSYYRLAPGFRIPFGHRHAMQEEIYVVLSGGGRAKVGEEIVELATWDALRLPAATPRALEAGPDGAEILAFGAPRVGREDVELLQDFWTD